MNILDNDSFSLIMYRIHDRRQLLRKLHEIAIPRIIEYCKYDVFDDETIKVIIDYLKEENYDAIKNLLSAFAPQYRNNALDHRKKEIIETGKEI